MVELKLLTGVMGVTTLTQIGFIGMALSLGIMLNGARYLVRQKYTLTYTFCFHSSYILSQKSKVSQMARIGQYGLKS